MPRIFITNINAYNSDMLKYLTDEQITKANKYKRENDKIRSIVASYLLNMVLNSLKINPVIIKNEYGKPLLKNNELFFNISHSEDYVILGISKNPIGVDIEKIKTLNKLVCEKMYSLSEQEFVKNDCDFFKVWTLKESYIKNKGIGISHNLNSFSTIKNKEITSIDDLLFKNFIFDNYSVSICYHGIEKFEIVYL